MEDGNDRSLDRRPQSWTSTWRFLENEPPGKTLSPTEVLADRYRIDTFLARGGMGVVYRATDLDLDAPVALKTIRPEIASDPASLRRFKQEVLLARSISHPNVCRIYDMRRDTERDVSFLTMEFLEGRTLSDRLRSSGTMAPDEALPLVRQMTEALGAAHRAGIVHRDFKSANVMLVPTDDGNRAVITDFGLAVTVGEDIQETAGLNSRMTDTSLTASMPRATRSRTRHIVGTPAYMSPEQVRGDPVSPASDLYSLGVVLYEMCTGQLPFHGSTPIETARSHLTSRPAAPSTLTTINQAWEQAILRLLAKRPTERYSTAHDVMLTLEGGSKGKHVPRHSLPAERDAFVGRKQELRALSQYLEANDAAATRLLTLQGAGGTGKTRLALKYGWDSVLSWPGGVWFCDLSETRNATGITSAVANELNVPLGREDPVGQLGRAIAARGRSLIILDNFEQVVGNAKDTVARWLERATEARFLVTSRARLQLQGETTHELEPLDPTTRGVELFEVRAWGHRPGFLVDPSNQKQIEGIVQKLDGLPLAIELAASRLRTLSPGKLEEGLADRFRILTGGKSGRHETLEATFDWSWDLLQPWEQSALTQVSVFDGGFTLEAAEVVIDLSGFDKDLFVLDVIQSLIDKSWLRPRVILGLPRFEMYTTIQDYTSTRLRIANTKAQTRGADSSPDLFAESRHGEYFAEMGSEESIEWLHSAGAQARRAIELESGNLVAACRRAFDRNDKSTAERTYVAASVALTQQGGADVLIPLGRAVLTILKTSADRGRVLRNLAGAERNSGKREDALEHYEAALAAFSEAGNGSGRGVTLGGLGNLHQDKGRTKEAKQHYEAALTVLREKGDWRSVGIVLSSLASLHHDQGNMAEARTVYEEALSAHREANNRRFEGVVLGNLGSLHADEGRTEEARETYEAAVAIHQEVGDRMSEGVGHGNLGLLAADLGHYDEARRHYEKALVVHSETGNKRFEGIVLGNLGLLQFDRGLFAEALEHYEMALAGHRETGDRWSEGILLGNLGNLHYKQGRVEEARAHLDAAVAIHRDVGNRRFEGNVLGDLGNLQAGEGSIEEAQITYETALAIHREVSNRRSEGVVLGDLGDLHAEQGRVEDASRYFAAAIRILRDPGLGLDLGPVLCGLGSLELKQGGVGAARAALAEAKAIASASASVQDSELRQRIADLERALERSTPES